MTQPAHPIKALLDRGLDHHRDGRLPEAADAYRQAIAIGAAALAHDLLGVILVEQGRPEEAEVEFRQALIHDPAFVSALGHRGNAFAARGRWPASLGCYRRALAIAGPDPLWLHNLGKALIEAGDAASAVTALVAANGRRAGDGTMLNDLGRAAVALGDGALAGRLFRQSVAAAPFLPEPAINLALVELDRGDSASTRRHALRANALTPASPDVFNAIAAADLAAHQPDAAVPRLHEALARRPDFAEAHYNLGLADFDRLRLAGADTHLRRALGLKPGYAEAEWNLALARLLGGEFLEGWRGYEARWRMRRCPTPPRHWPVPEWQGEDLAGRRILLHAEQGLGDTLQFIRYAPLVAERGGRVIVECQPQLRRLLALMPSIEGVCAQGETLPVFDRHAPLLSLPRIFGTTLDTIPRTVPYLVADEPSAVSPVRPIIGVVWGGSADNPRDRARSLSPETARILARRLLDASIGDVVNLQFGPRADELGNLLPRPAGWGNGYFLNTARVLENISVVVGIDTSTLHLAGGLGRPGLVLLPHVPDFRWLLGRNDSPWYPTFRLLRQERPGDWASVLENVPATVAAMVESQVSQRLLLRAHTPADSKQIEKDRDTISRV